MQQSTSKHPRWQAFASLSWYAGLISFLFRFLAMTSEPLLALGVILSAADFLQQGHLMAHNAALQAAWSWAQAISIEASTGPTLAFSLDAFRAGDKIKGRLYATLASLLFIVGGCMLYLQLISNATGMSEAAVSPWVLYPLLALRVLVASGIVALLCTKHMRFSGLVAHSATAQTAPVLNLQEVIDELDNRLQHRIEGVYQRLDFKLEQAIGNSQEIPAITPAMIAGLLPPPEPGKSLVDVIAESTVEQAPEPIKGLPSYGDKIEALWHSHPGLSALEIATSVGCSVPTASKWKKRLEVPGEGKPA